MLFEIRTILRRRVTPAGSLMAVAGLLSLAGCAPRPDDGDPSSFDAAADAATIIEPVPDAPVIADEGLPGTMEPIRGLEPPARQFCVAPDDEGPHPAVLLLHTHWGLDESHRSFARRLAAAGFSVCSPDVFEGVTSTSTRTREKLLNGVSRKRATQLVRAALADLPNREGVIEGAIGVVGLGPGGVWAYEALAAGQASGVDASAVEIRVLALDATRFRDEQAELAPVPCPVLLIHGERDAAYSGASGADMVARLEAAATGGVTVRSIPGAGVQVFDTHIRAYSEWADREAFELLIESLRRHTASESS
ncbi:MAG: dienelactone hydrolase family protein [Acidobacteriota bacterium]|nr:MAG: dienelactone hydrolase family protein [Acidobacteriota bacterium]